MFAKHIPSPRVDLIQILQPELGGLQKSNENITYYAIRGFVSAKLELLLLENYNFPNRPITYIGLIELLLRYFQHHKLGVTNIYIANRRKRGKKDKLNYIFLVESHW